VAAELRWADRQHSLCVLIPYAVIALVGGFPPQPYIMKRTAKVPMWASILAPIALGIVTPFWGVLLVPPLLAVLCVYPTRRTPVR
jgi:predicted PurR-regulated permease PerM